MNYRTERPRRSGLLVKVALLGVAVLLIYKCNQRETVTHTVSMVQGGSSQVLNLNSLSDGERKNYSGYGVRDYWFGKRYEGEWHLGSPHGNGTMTYPSGDSYSGGFSRGVRHGEGTLNYASGSVYEGGWAKDERHGYGVMTYPDGSLQVGMWEKGRYLGGSSGF